MLLSAASRTYAARHVCGIPRKRRYGLSLLDFEVKTALLSFAVRKASHRAYIIADQRNSLRLARND